jgi:protein TonB
VLNLIPSVETALSAYAPPATPQDRVDVTLPGARSFSTSRLRPPSRKVIARVKPAYPPEAERLGLEAYVVLKLTVNPAGEVTKIERINGVVNLRSDEPNASARAEFYAADPYAFTVEAETAAKQWTFEAANSSMTCFVAFTFHLAPGPDLTTNTPIRPGSATLSAVPGSPRPGFTVPGRPLRVDGRMIKAPTRLVSVNPVYPDDARGAHVEGVVLLEITIAEDGSVTGARVLRSVPLLDQAALEAVRQWVYEPTLLNGVPIAVTLTVTINFTLQ